MVLRYVVVDADGKEVSDHAEEAEARRLKECVERVMAVEVKP